VMDTNLVLPLGPDRCRVTFEFYFAHTEGPEAEKFIADSMAVAHQVQLEDMSVCQEVQRGLKSRTYSTGRFSVRRESGGYHFHQLLARNFSHSGRFTYRGQATMRYRVLSGLPPYGPLAEPFIVSGRRRHSEGYVVQFTRSAGDSWVGNFQRGAGAIDTVVEHPNGKELLVISGGQGYVVDPEDRCKREYFGGCIDSVFPVEENKTVILGNGLWFEAFGVAGPLWRSKQVSWDGLRELRHDGTILRGEAWSPVEDCWLPFELDLITGSHQGGSYNGP